MFSFKTLRIFLLFKKNEFLNFKIIRLIRNHLSIYYSKLIFSPFHSSTVITTYQSSWHFKKINDTCNNIWCTSWIPCNKHNTSEVAIRSCNQPRSMLSLILFLMLRCRFPWLTRGIYSRFFHTWSLLKLLFWSFWKSWSDNK